MLKMRWMQWLFEYKADGSIHAVSGMNEWHLLSQHRSAAQPQSAKTITFAGFVVMPIFAGIEQAPIFLKSGLDIY